MNKKYLSALLFGALTLASTGTFTSCKDYDDDIENLQGQVDKLATKEDLSSQISTLQTALNNAAKDAKDAITKATQAEQAAKAAGDAAKAAQAAAEKAAADAEAKAIEAAKKIVAEAETNLKKLVADGLAENKEAMDAMRAEVEEATKKVEETIGAVTGMVTHVDLVASYGAWVNSYYTTLHYKTAVEKENVFGEGLSNALPFHKGTQVQTPAESFIVRVSPANAILKPEMISLVNSKGENLDDMIEIVDVQKYDELITNRRYNEEYQSKAANNNGLWLVKTALKNYDEEQFAAAEKTEDGNILYAVQVNNTLSTAESRYVTSSYELAIDWDKFVGEKELNYFAGGKNVNELANRFYTDGLAKGLTTIANPYSVVEISYKDLAWTGEAQVKGIAESTDPTKINAALDKYDNRNWNIPMLPVEQGKAFKISLTTSNDKVVAPTNIRAMYVTLDVKENAVESDPSEWEAWKTAYQYTGLNTVVEGTETEITINSANAINDIIGFRVYAVNYDGTLVDPDGKAFYVSVGKNVQDTHFNLTWTWKNANESEVSLAEIPEGFFDEKFVNELKSAPVIEADTVAYGDVEGKKFITSEFAINYLDKDKNPVTWGKDAKYLTLKLNNVADSDKPYYYDDNKVYTAKVAYKNDRGNVLRYVVVNFKKVVPTAIPEEYSRKSSQIVKDVYTCYLNGTYDSEVGAWNKQDVEGFGQMQLFNVFNGLEDVNYVFSFAEATEDGDKLVNTTVTSLNNYQLLVANKFIDNKTKHATTVEYNYGKISSETVDAEGQIADFKLPADKFETIFACPFSVSTWSWVEKYDPTDKKEEAVKAEVAYGVKASFASSRVFGTNTYTKTLTAGLDVLMANGVKEIKNCSLASVENSEKEYFKVNYVATSKEFVFTPIETSVESNPTEDVPSKLNIVFIDIFGHENTITLDFTVKKN